VPVLHRLKGAQAYENAMLALGQGALALMRWTSTRRLQVQLLAVGLLMALAPWLLAHPLPRLPMPSWRRPTCRSPCCG
jgi:multicomponent K+:H+ antiporter subunit A